MQYRNSKLGVTVTRPESERFGVPILLVHGLWTGSWLWERLSGFLGHRGWEVWAVDLPGRRGAAEPEGRRATAGDLVSHCRAVAEEMPAPPVVVGHDAGASIALRLASSISTSAVVLAAPAVPGSGALAFAFSGVRRTLRSIWGGALRPPEGIGERAYFERVDPTVVQMVRARLVPESGRAAYDLLRGRFEAREAATGPTLIVGGRDDRVAPPNRIEELARVLDASCVVAPGGHWLPVEEAWREVGNAVHRWVVQTLGDPILLLRDDDGSSADEN